MDQKINNKLKGQTILAVVMWASGISLTVTGLASSLLSTKFDKIDSIAQLATNKNATQDIELAVLKQSLCLQNQNIVNVGKALNVTVISDPNCK